MQDDVRQLEIVRSPIWNVSVGLTSEARMANCVMPRFARGFVKVPARCSRSHRALSFRIITRVLRMAGMQFFLYI